MKNVVVIVLSLLCTVAVVIGSLLYTGVIGGEKVEESNVLIQKDDNGLTYTQRAFSWKPVEYKKQILLVPDTSKVSKRVVTVNLHDNVYYDIKVPADSTYFCDYGKTVFANDGTWQIRVLAEADVSTIAALAGIKNSQSLSSNVIQTNYEDKGAKSIATIIDGYAIVCTVYEGDIAYTLMRNSLVENQKTYTVNTPEYADGYTKLSDLKYNGPYVAQIKYSKNDIHLEQWYFAEGNLYLTTELRGLTTIKNDYLIKLCKSANAKISEIYDDGAIVYATAGDYHLGMVTYNSNTTIIIMGNGDEAECNILSYLINLM